ncbi:hypothetical protein EI555_005550, partial [Monodon monoceros]
ITSCEVYSLKSDRVLYTLTNNCLTQLRLEEALDTAQRQRVLRSSAQSTQQRQSALSPAGPPTGTRARWAEALSPAARTAREEVGRGVAAQLHRVITAQAWPRGRWLRTRCPHLPGGPGSPPGPSGAHCPAASAPQRAQDPRCSQTTQGLGPQLGHPLPATLPRRLSWRITGPWRQPP